MEKENKNIINTLLQVEDEDRLLFPVDVLDLPPRIRHSLKRNGIFTINGLVKNWKYISNFRNMGDKSILEIIDKLSLWYREGGMPSTSGRPNIQNNEVIEEHYVENQINEERPLGFDESHQDIPIEALNLPLRAYNALKRADVNTIGQLYKEWGNIDSINNVGAMTIEQIQKALVQFQNTDIKDKKVDGKTLLKANPQIPGSETSHVLREDESVIAQTIYKLILPNPILSLLKKNGIHTIDQITSTRLKELRSHKSITLLTIREIQTAIQYWLSKDEKRNGLYLETMQAEGINTFLEDVGFEEYFVDFVGLLSPRYISAIEHRYGLRTGNKRTLEETAKHVGVTRERIRQIESLALGKLRSELGQLSRSILVTKIKESVDNRSGLISESRLVDELQNAFMFKSYSMKGVVEFVNKLFDGEIKDNQGNLKLIYLQTLSGWSTSFYDRDQIFHTVNKILEMLSASDFPMQWDELYSALIQEDGLLTLDENLAHAVALCLSDTQRIQRQMDGGWSNTEKETRHSRIVKVMRQMGVPAHFSEITERYNQIYQDQTQTEHALHAILSGRNEFVRVGRGKYGLPEWGLHNDGSVANAVRRILANHNGPMQLEDIMEEVLKTWDVSKSSIVAAIDVDARFSKTEDGKIWLTKTGLQIKKRKKRDDDTRGERFILIMRKLGEPAPVQLILNEHNKVYPHKPLTLQAARNLMSRRTEFIRTGLDEFGLAEWGVQPAETISSYDRGSEILELIKENSPIPFDDLFELYNGMYSDRPISRNTLNMYLSKIRSEISSPRRGVYQLADQQSSGLPAKNRQLNDQTYSQKLTRVMEEIGQSAHVDEIFDVYKHLYPTEEKEYVDIRRALYNNKKTLVNHGVGFFGLPGWDPPQNISHQPRQNYVTTSAKSNKESRYDRVRKIFNELGRPARAKEILAKYNELYPETPINRNGLYSLFYKYKENFVKVAGGMYGLSTWENLEEFQSTAAPSRRDRLIITLQSIGMPSKLQYIVQEYNKLYPDQPLSYAVFVSEMSKNSDVFAKLDHGIYTLIEAKEDKHGDS